PNSDPEDGSRPGQVSTGSARRPSLLTARRPPSSRIHTPPLASPSIAPPDLIEDGGASSTPKRLLDEADRQTITPKRRASISPMPSSSPDEDIKPKIKQEHMDTSASPDDVKKRTCADAESNTMHSGKLIVYS
ncbi:putative B-cell CLL/lymphoma 11A, partial [Operophtera brumata]